MEGELFLDGNWAVICNGCYVNSGNKKNKQRIRQFYVPGELRPFNEPLFLLAARLDRRL